MGRNDNEIDVVLPDPINNVVGESLNDPLAESVSQ
jgi:hypothetical protein